MHVCGILPTTGKKWAAKTFGGLIAAGRFMNIAQNGKRVEREKMGRLIAAGRREMGSEKIGGLFAVQNGKRMEREKWAG